MRGHIRKRSKGSWALVYTVGGKQQWETVQGTKREAEKRLAEIITKINKGQYVPPAKMTLAQWLDEWLETAIAPPNKNARTFQTYAGVVNNHLKPKLGDIRLQQLQPEQIKRYYNESKLSQSSLRLHQAVIHKALGDAVLSKRVERNVASLVLGKPKAKRSPDDVKQNCWMAEEAKRFLEIARSAGPQQAALYTLAIETGMRRAEIGGLRWEDTNLKDCKIAVVRQLVKTGEEPEFAPPKNCKALSIDISPQTAALLATHKSHQAELKMRNRNTYKDHGLVFANDWSHLKKKWDRLGAALRMSNIAERELPRLIEEAAVKKITFHGLRHTSATLALAAGVPAKVVQERLGHSSIAITLDIYAHVLPSMQKEAAERISSVIQ